jgi:L-alanine-DL-glutamate epimerase-like enolase superfamily enzyme
VFYEWYKRPEQIVDEALRWIDEGWTAHKLRMGTDWAHSGITASAFLELMAKVAEAVDGRMDLMVDAGSRCRSVQEALDVANGLAELGFLWLEEPLKREPELNAELTSQVDILITGGEGFVSPPQFAPYLQQGAYDVVQPDSSRTGLTGWMKVASLAQRYGAPCIPHTWFNAVVIASNVHAVAAIPNRMFMEYNANHNPLKHEILVDPIVPEKGTFHLSGRPGLGIELDERALARFPYVEGSQYVPLELPE